MRAAAVKINPEDFILSAISPEERLDAAFKEIWEVSLLYLLRQLKLIPRAKNPGTLPVLFRFLSGASRIQLII